MTATETLKKSWTASEYLEREFIHPQRHEFQNGQTKAMGYASEIHELLVSNLIRFFGNALSDSDARVYGSNRMLNIEGTENFYYADVMIVVGPSRFRDFKRKMQATLNPAVLVEVLSESNDSPEFIMKLADYRKISSLRQFILVHQYQRMVEIHTRLNDSNEWVCATFEAMGDRLKILHFEITVGQIYAKAWHLAQ